MLPLQIDNLRYLYAILFNIPLFALSVGIQLFLIFKMLRKKIGYKILPVIFFVLITNIVVAEDVVSATYKDKIFEQLQKSEYTTEGTIISNELSSEGHGYCDIAYQYEVGTEEGKIKYMQREKLQACNLLPSAVVRVRYDPENPVITLLDIPDVYKLLRPGVIENYAVVSVMVIVFLSLNYGWLVFNISSKSKSRCHRSSYKTKTR